MKIRDKDFSWKITKREVKLRERQWNYGNPISPDMRSLNLHEFQQISIDWRMLTSLRPKLNQDEEMFSRLVRSHSNITHKYTKMLCLKLFENSLCKLIGRNRKIGT